MSGHRSTRAASGSRGRPAGSARAGACPARLGLAYPLARPFRTAMQLGMFALVIFTPASSCGGQPPLRCSRRPGTSGHRRPATTWCVDSSPGNPVPAAGSRRQPGVAAVAPLVRAFPEFSAPRAPGARRLVPDRASIESPPGAGHARPRVDAGSRYRQRPGRVRGRARGHPTSPSSPTGSCRSAAAPGRIRPGRVPRHPEPGDGRGTAAARGRDGGRGLGAGRRDGVRPTARQVLGPAPWRVGRIAAGYRERTRTRWRPPSRTADRPRRGR